MLFSEFIAAKYGCDLQLLNSL